MFKDIKENFATKTKEIGAEELKKVVTRTMVGKSYNTETYNQFI